VARAAAAGVAVLALAGCGGGADPSDGRREARDDIRPPVPAGAFTATVERVVDGDTFLARSEGRLRRVRLIGIDAPESVKPDAPVDCFGRESARRLRALLPRGTTVRAAHEPGGDRDRYGRQLWDVWLADGRFLQALLVRDGAARARVYRPQRTYADLLARLGDRARAERAGLWGACAG
jgi:micrococcal nuclease